MSDIKKIAEQTAVYGIPTIVGRFLNYFLVPLYTYNIAASAYGMVSELYAYVSFLMIILTYGMETAFFRFSQDYDKGKVFNTAMLSLFCSSTLFLIITFVCLNPITSALEYDNHKNYIVLFLLILALDVLRAIPYALLRRENKAKRFAMIKTIDIFSNILFNLFFIALCPFLLKHYSPSFIASWFRSDDLVFYIFLSNFFASAISFLLLLPEYKTFRFDFDFKLLKKMLAYGFPVMIGGLAGMVNETFDRIALKHIVNVPTDIDASQNSSWKMSQIGIYGACYKLSIVISLFIQAFKFAAEPFFFSKMKKNDAKQSYSSVMTAFVMFLSLIFLVVMCYIDIFQYFMGREYRVGLAVVPILLMANIFLGIYYNLSIWYKVTDKTKWGAIIAVIGAVITLAGNYLLVPNMSYMGAAITTLVCYVAIALICYFVGQHYYPVKYNIKRCLMYILLALVLYAFSEMLHCFDLGTFVNILVGTILIVLYLAIAYKMDIKRMLQER